MMMGAAYVGAAFRATLSDCGEPRSIILARPDCRCGIWRRSRPAPVFGSQAGPLPANKAWYATMRSAPRRAGAICR